MRFIFSNKPGRQWDETFAVDKNNDKVKLVLNTRFKASEVSNHVWSCGVSK